MSKKQPIPRELRKKVFERDNYTCRYCGKRGGELQADHVYPESKGGETSINNLVTACKKCNYDKRARVGVWPMPVDKSTRLNELESKQKHLILSGLNISLLFNAIGVFAFSVLAYAIEAKDPTIGMVSVIGIWVGVAGSVAMWLFEKFSDRSM